MMQHSDIFSRSQFIKEEARRLGFLHCGISEAGFLEQEAPRLEQWLRSGMHGTMGYMENHFDKRLDPRLLVPGAKSVVSFLLNYYPSKTQEDPAAPRISKYAYGEDYHHVIKRKLATLFENIRKEIGEVEGRAFVDSAPVLDRAWAAKSGLGWIGKNTNLLNKDSGSFFFLAEIILDLELQPDSPVADHCGTCTRCIDACPTDAITPYQVDGSKCISYFTIELKENLPDGLEDQFNNWAFGCDICQDVCPWNRFSKPHNESAFDPSDRLINLTEREWYEITEDVFGALFAKSAVKRTKYAGLKRNLEYLRRKRSHKLQ